MKTVYLALFFDGDNGLDGIDYDSEMYLYAKDLKLFEQKEDALNYLKKEVFKHYQHEENAEDEINDLLKNLNKNGFYRDAENDAYILLTKTIN